ncbi:unnamed protein product [Schistosoma guineensis]|uniref:Sm protein B n=5 Tax=Schistosoma TaxID=6181 RepID=A0A183K5U5_9TREM|nr:hypothetical protein MS3_00008360 [Schistosoma haematobium]CAH8586810.1 unnamed protein product [Schistosoma mattheei]CAH8609421.1 unnamed protein product [Schistosoma guineensis]CAH8611944.1 unnamed protein product [Schistosoma bovis]CAH8614303.1 unnamed protein product [Schistosoma curassoni]KAH9581134.1 hypothetical protein MS3_00008360 [Schistosoma haematobium]
MPVSKNAKISQHVNYRIRCTMQDGRQLVGTFKAFDRHMNIILCDCDEFRQVKNKTAKQDKDRQEKRALGLVLLRGEHVVTMNVDGPPPPEDAARVPLPTAGAWSTGVKPLTGIAVGRGMPLATPAAAIAPAPPAGLGGPVWGVGAPAPGLMQPRALPGMPPPPPPPAGAPTAAFGRGMPTVTAVRGYPPPPPPPPPGYH